MGLLPSGYTRLEYIQSSGTQYIDTGILSSSTTYYDITFAFTESTSSKALYGAVEGSQANDLQIGQIRIGNTDCLGTTLTVNQKYNFKWDSTGCYLDGTSTGKTPGSGFPTSNNIYLFRANSSITTYYGLGKIYNCKMYNGSTLVRHFIPACNSSDVVGMYDLVSRTFFTNAGTGSFTAGPETYDLFNVRQSYEVMPDPEWQNLPSGYTQLEYIENTTYGPWFDTGIATITEKTVVEIKGYVNNYNSWFGGDGGANPYFNVTSVSSGGQVPFRYGSSASYKISVTAGQLYSTPATLKFGNNKMYVNGELKLTLSEEAFTFNTYSLKIWSRMGGNTDQARGRIYFANVYSEDTLQFQGVPAKRDSDSAIGLYDLVSDTFIANSGSGAFTAGPVACATKAVPVKLARYLCLTDNLYSSPITPTTRPTTWTSIICPLSPGASYSFSGNPGDGSIQIAFYDSTGTYIDYWSTSDTTTSGRAWRRWLVVPDNTVYWCIYALNSTTTDDHQPMVLDGNASATDHNTYRAMYSTKNIRQSYYYLA